MEGSTANSEGEKDFSVTMLDVLQDEEDLQNDADAVLGAGDDSSCTYDMGYMKRQALYSCLTCCSKENETVAGVCLGCSYHCHEGHELIELYTKRHFRCDCGNSKFPSNHCKLNNTKTSINAENSYNQNFKGTYCTCSRPYPDPDDSIDDNMIQCTICEDWFHGRHLKLDEIPSEEDYEEMICFSCSAKLTFIKSYSNLAVSSAVNDVDESKGENTATSDQTTPQGQCTRDKVSEDCKIPVGTLFMKEKWRNKLCACSQCKDLYRDLKVDFLVDSEDTMSFYESEGRSKRKSLTSGVQQELAALSSLDRNTRIEVVHEYNDLSSSLREYLKTFADSGKVVEGDDIKKFFSDFSAVKKRKLNNMQYFCK